MLSIPAASPVSHPTAPYAYSQGQLCLRMDVNHPVFDVALLEELSDWNELKDRYRNGSISQADYDHWRYHYPEDKSAEFRNRMAELRVAGFQSEEK